MDYISFYRKWRPQNFDEVIGQDYNIQTLKNALARKKLSHSYIFCGPRGTGKTTTARILAKAINCNKGITPDPCNNCDNCISISNGSSPDVIEIDAASNRGINEIRELREKVKYLPSVLRKKVYIIDEVHMLTPEAFNALLKVLEEPPGHVVFIMATTEPNKVLPTIMSRCQRFDFHPIPLELIKKRLELIAGKEGIKVSKEALAHIARYSDGSLRDADGILEQLAAYSSDMIEAGDVESLLGVVDVELLFKLTGILLERDINGCIAFVKEILSASQNLRVFVSEFIDHLYNLYVAMNYSDPGEIIETSNDYLEMYNAQARRFQKEEIEFYIEIFTDLLKQVRWGENAKTYFKAAVMRAASFIVLDEEKINKKTAALEARVRFLEELIKNTGPDSGKYSGKDGIKKAPLPEEKEKSGSPYSGPGKPGELHITGDEDNTAGMAGEEKTEESRDDDFDIINSGALDEPAKTKMAGQNPRVKPDSKDTDIIYNNLQKITELIRTKKISVQAMFVEAEFYRVEDGTVYFVLDSSRKWHRDHLSKKENLELVSSVIREITGKKFQVKFELGDIDNKNQIKNNYGSQQVKEEEADFIKGPPEPYAGKIGGSTGKSGMDKKNGEVPSTGSADNQVHGKKGKTPGGLPAGVREYGKKGTIRESGSDDNEDILKYLEKKFNIEE
ncbi:MAG: DNA polymerase III subunit gamma/tau [Actinobacteria bacterium]|nr:DNA polymerase III subunit gamma/tau [Actinomycetota bacterium]